MLHYRPSICPCRIRVENALKTHVKRISFPTRISKIQSKPTIHMRWTANQKGSSALPDLLRVNQWLFHYWNQDNSEKHFPHITLCLLFLFLFCVNGTPLFFAIVARYFMSADFTSHCICLTSVTIPLCGPVHRVQSNHIKQVRGSLLSGLGIRFQNLNLLHFDQITGLKSLSIYLILLAQLNLGLQMDRPLVQA